MKKLLAVIGLALLCVPTFSQVLNLKVVKPYYHYYFAYDYDYTMAMSDKFIPGDNYETLDYRLSPSKSYYVFVNGYLMRTISGESYDTENVPVDPYTGTPIYSFQIKTQK